MLILAGVSINAVVGDNGIITQAQSATYATSRAVLEEWLQQLYVENYDEFSAYATQLYGFTRLESEYSVYFYIPSRDADDVSLPYVVDSNDNALYLINKSALPDEIRSQIAGGDAGDGTYADYLALNDVYGVTSDLKVYYCSAGLSTILGATEDDLDEDTPARKVTLSTELANLLGTDTTVSAESLRTIKTLTIDSTITSLSELYNLTSLQELTIEGANLSNLSGIENCSQLYYVYFKSSTVGDYSAMVKLGSKLQYLYFYDIDDEELETACTGLASGEFSGLEYLAVVGNTEKISSIFTTADHATNTNYKNKSTNTITSLEPLNRLSGTTKLAVRYLSIQNNNIIGDLSLISEYTNLILLRCEYNSLTSLNGLNNMTNLKYLCGAENQLGATQGINSEGNNTTLAENTETGTAISSLANKTALYSVNLINNPYLANVSYFQYDTAIEYLYLAGCSSSMSVTIIGEANILNNCTDYSIPVMYLSGFVFNLSEYFTPSEFTDSQLVQYLKNNTTITHLNLTGASSLSNDILNEVLETMTSLQYLSLSGCSNLTDISFVHSMTTTEGITTGVTSLIELNLLGTGVTNLENLNNYGTNLITLVIDNENIDLTKIQTVINHCTSQSGDYWENTYGGLCILNAALLAKLGNCTNVTTLVMRNPDSYSGIEIDLSGMTSLTNLWTRQMKIYFTLPSSIENYDGIHVTPPILSEGTQDVLTLKIDVNVFDISSDVWKASLKSFNNCNSIETLQITRADENFTTSLFISAGVTANISKLILGNTAKQYTREKITDIYGLRNIASGLTTLVLQYNSYFSDLSELSYLTSLTSLSIIGCDFTETSYLEEITGLQELNLNDNSIDGLKFLSNLTNITTLYLKNNCIYDTSTYKNNNGETIKYQNLQIIADLYEQGALRTLYISGNKGITDYSLIVSCTDLKTDL